MSTLNEAFMAMLALIGAGVEFSVAYEHVCLRFELDAADRKALMLMYDKKGNTE